ncbi:hypothetical protein LOC68_15305 [Blastopirellula sp. JC732]|uniref:Uncharacterized protein n=1 Tax=Blastopirellula sediminis TaxID=2894196 RepID=A0A9X1SHF6_9BACT|nr:hypothetical protein [Blastopirellula sediminis]MCC9606949.1 hypothetical protein [Blastopirellula sediminis]MCC9629756.1 hypothetical protein [Blastopirellula sediminis]
MAHRHIQPRKDETFLSVEETKTRLSLAFPECVFDDQQGTEIADTMIAKLEQLRAPADLLAFYYDRRDEATRCFVSDSSISAEGVQFTLWRDGPLFIGFHSASHEEATLPLLDRIAAALDYEVSW